MRREITKAKTTYCYSLCQLKQPVENRKRCGVGSGWAACLNTMSVRRQEQQPRTSDSGVGVLPVWFPFCGAGSFETYRGGITKHEPPDYSKTLARCSIRSTSAQTPNEIIRCLRSSLQRVSRTRSFRCHGINSPETRSAQLFTRRLELATGVVRVFGQITQERKELLRLAHEESAGREELGGPDCSPLCVGWANDRACRELPAEEYGGFRHDQVGLEVLSAERSGIEVRKYQRRIFGVGQSRCIASLVLPRLKVHGLSWAYAEHNSQDLHIGYSLS